jgi:PPOX class probable F420-dependent enzyme
MLDEQINKLAQGKNFAAVTTLLPDGTPQTKPLWVDSDGEHLLLNTEVHRQRYGNIQKDPHITVTIVEAGNWYSWAEVRGHFDGEVRGAEARAHIDKLSRKYTGDDYANPVRSERVILRVAPDRQNVRSG